MGPNVTRRLIEIYAMYSNDRGVVFVLEKKIYKCKTVDESIIVNGIKYKSAANFIEQMSKTTVYNSIQDESNIRNISVNNNNNYTIPFNVMFGFWEKVKENVNKTASNISDSIGVTFTDVKDYMESLKKKENEGSSNIYNFTSTKFNEMKKSVNLNGIGFSWVNNFKFYIIVLCIIIIIIALLASGNIQVLGIIINITFTIIQV
uniref:Myristylated protein n=1 Tax=Parastrongyloides trichosuri TaxID=131310 RepID=A0A0N4ZLL1_PARTI